jgi:hypothetical protein
MTLTEFLLARIEEDEADAKDGLYVQGDLGEMRRRNRILGDVLVKREIIAIHTPDHECTTPEDGYAGVFMPDGGGALRACPTLLYIALPYASHPDYDPTWT